MLRVIQDPYKDRKKDLVQHGKCVLHKVLNSYFFLGSQRMPRVSKNIFVMGQPIFRSVSWLNREMPMMIKLKFY